MDRNFPQSMETQPCDKCQRVTCSTLHSNTNLTNCFPKGCDICLERVKIDAEIANLEDRLFKLANKRLEITQNLNSRHDRLITRLPIELVSRIFMFAAESNVVEYFEADRPFAWHPSILLNAVSKGWRNVALSTPQLWTSIIIDLSIDHLKTDITTEWLGRSRALPISITFKSHSLDKSNADYLNLLNIIQSHSTRWKCVHFSNWSFDNGLLEGLQGPHLLDSLTIDLAMGSYHNNSFSMTSLPNEKLLAPKNFDARYCSLARLPLRWDSLTHLEVALITVDEVLQVICHASRITHLTERLALLPPGKSFPLPTTPIVNYALQCLTIHSTEFSQGANLLQYITLPLLRNFDYSFKNQEGTLDILIGFLDRSQAPLDDFVFAFPVTAPNQLPHHGHWFERLPQITQLKLFLDSTLNESKWLDTFFITLNYDNDQNASLVLPKLRRLDISAPKLSRLSWSLFSCIFPRPGGFRR